MKKMKITENELITLIEKIVNEQGVAFGGFGQNMGISKPTSRSIKKKIPKTVPMITNKPFR